MSQPNITFKTTIRVLSLFSGSTKFDFWNSLQVGDLLELEVSPVHGIWIPKAPRMIVTNLRNEEAFSGTAIQIRNTYLYKLNYEIVHYHEVSSEEMEKLEFDQDFLMCMKEAIIKLRGEIELSTLMEEAHKIFGLKYKDNI